MFGLEDRHINFIKEVLKKHLNNSEAKCYIFGSRAKGNYKKYSDVDIAIDYPEITNHEYSQIQADFENSTFPYEVDIVDLNKVEDYFKNLIKDNLIEIKL